MSKTARPKNIATKKILVVDDEGQMGLVLDMILHESRFELDYVKDLLSADEYLKKSPISKYWQYEIDELYLYDGQGYRMPAVQLN